MDNAKTIESQAVTPETLRPIVSGLCRKNYRYVTVTCCNNRDGSFDLIYSFDRNLDLCNLLLCVQKADVVPSISGVVLAAAFAENEISELFGLHFEGLAIDYGGRFIVTEGTPEEPFGKGIMVVNKTAPKQPQ